MVISKKILPVQILLSIPDLESFSEIPPIRVDVWKQFLKCQGYLGLKGL